jgi:predicted membrane protein
MRVRQSLALIWVLCLAIALCAVESYFWRQTDAGVPYLLSVDRTAVYPTLVGIYAATIGPLLAALFFRPFRPPANVKSRTLIGRLALGLTLFYNLVLIYIISQGHWHQSITIDDILAQAKLAATILAFLVVPVNGYYFGLKS